MNSAVWTALVLIGLGVWSTPSSAQVITPDPPQICRSLTDGDKWYPKYTSCCDINGSESVWFNAESGQEERYVFLCNLLGVQPGPPELDLNREEIASRYAYDVGRGIPPGTYSCSIQSTNSIVINVVSVSEYSTTNGSRGTYSVSSEEADSTGKLIKYKITGGDLDGFHLMLRDNGEVAMGIGFGWGKCYPQ